MKTIIWITIIAAALSSAMFAERLPEHKSGTIQVMKTLRGEDGGVDPYLLAYKRITRPSLPESYDTPEGHFKIHYAVSGSDAVDSTGYVYNIGRYLERSWKAYMDTIGYLPPPPDGTEGGDAKYDVYLKNLSAYGITWPGPDGPQPWTDWTSYIEIENDFDGVYPNDDPEGPVAGAMKITCAHEFHHAVQYGLCGTSSAWIAEITSVSFEERIYPMVNDYVWLIDYLSNDPHYPIDSDFGYHMYGLGLFGQYLNMMFGDDFLFEVWDTMRFIDDWDALVAISEKIGDGLGEIFSDFGAVAIFIGSRDCGIFPDGAALNDMSVENTHSSYPADGSPVIEPYGYGLSYSIFSGFPTEDIDLNITFHGEQTAGWFVKAVRREGDSLILFDVVSGDTSGSAVVPLVNDADYVAMVAVPAGATGERFDYEYSAIIEPSAVAERRLPGAARLNAYPNPFNSVCTFEMTGVETGEIEIFDISGRPIRQIQLSIDGAAVWDGLDEAGEELPSGTYLARAAGLVRAVTLIK